MPWRLSGHGTSAVLTGRVGRETVSRSYMTDPKSWSLLNDEAKRQILGQWTKTIQVADTDIEITLKETS
tara:strand:+ start:257 stop:463 length:207 start_codon:yes stop_codon:yes gene_type:complete